MWNRRQNKSESGRLLHNIIAPISLVSLVCPVCQYYSMVVLAPGKIIGIASSCNPLWNLPELWKVASWEKVSCSAWRWFLLFLLAKVQGVFINKKIILILNTVFYESMSDHPNHV